MFLCNLGDLISNDARKVLKRSGLGLKKFLEQFPDEFHIGKLSGNDAVRYTPSSSGIRSGRKLGGIQQSDFSPRQRPSRTSSPEAVSVLSTGGAQVWESTRKASMASAGCLDLQPCAPPSAETPKSLATRFSIPATPCSKTPRYEEESLPLPGLFGKHIDEPFPGNFARGEACDQGCSTPSLWGSPALPDVRGDTCKQGLATPSFWGPPPLTDVRGDASGQVRAMLRAWGSTLPSVQEDAFEHPLPLDISSS